MRGRAARRALSVQSSAKREAEVREAHICNMATTNYTAKDITVLEGIEPVRNRPGMYIGGVGSDGLHHPVWGTLDNAVDEAINGYASNNRVTPYADGSSITLEGSGD